jgi:hypothetical protein
MNELRMYFFVMYNLSGIQKGIQAGHAAIEYELKHGNKKVYKDFATHHKTFILLDGGGSRDMESRMAELEYFKVDHAPFYEPDLNDSLSAIAFIVPESIYGMDIKAIGDLTFVTRNEEFARYLKSFKLASN